MAQILNAADIPYYITGGVAAIAHGEPRATIDLDIVISIERLSRSYGDKLCLFE